MSTPQTTAVPQDEETSHGPHRSAETLYAIELLKRDIPVSGAERHAIAQAMHTSQIVPPHLRTVADIHGAYTAAIGLRISVYDVLQNLLIEDGKVAFKAAFMQARVTNAGHSIRVMEATKKACRVRIIRNDDPEPHYVGYDWDDAETANLTNKRSWKNHPEEMLAARCVAKAVRRVCPEVLSGPAYTPEEFGAEVDEDGNVLAAPVSPAAPPPPPPVKPERVPVIEHPVTGTDMTQERPGGGTGGKERRQQEWQRRIETAPDAAAVTDLRGEAAQVGILDRELYPDDGTTVRQALDARLATLAHCAADDVADDDVIEVGVLNGDDDDPGFPGEAPKPGPGDRDAETETAAFAVPKPDDPKRCEMNAARKGLLAGLADRAGGVRAVRAMVEARYGLPIEQVSNSRLIELATHPAGEQ